MANAAPARESRWRGFWVNLRAWLADLGDGEGRYVIGAARCPSCGRWVNTRDGYRPGEVPDQAYLCQHTVGFPGPICDTSNKPLPTN